MAATTMKSISDAATHQNPKDMVCYQSGTFGSQAASRTCVHNFGQHAYGSASTNQVIVYPIVHSLIPAASTSPYIASRGNKSFIMNNPTGGLKALRFTVFAMCPPSIMGGTR